tara:strand:- start:236 stop:469 length:234 start_codon:yes stop_codon:yes gene_type:complete
MKKYGDTKTSKIFQERHQCREIIGEIMKFGVSESQKLRIIYLLSLELEDNNLMKEIASICKERLEESTEEENKIIDI